MPAPTEWYQLRELVAQRRFEEASSLLELSPSVRIAVNGLGETVLHYLAVENDEQGVAWLSSQGFDINTRNEFGTPVAFEVAQLDYGQLFQWFISNGADVRCRDRDGRDIKEYVLEFDQAGSHKEIAQYLASLGL